MNTSDLVPDFIRGLDFDFLSKEEIITTSVKKIESDTTFDTLLNPYPGGLYDGSLGSYGESFCDTCNLRHAQCPGHAGHILLPGPVYHPIFLDQVVRLLRSQCRYCGGLKLGLREVHGYVCKLRLLQYGMFWEASQIDSFSDDSPGNGMGHADSEAEEEGNSSIDAVIKARDSFVRNSLRQGKPSMAAVRKGKHEAPCQMRRDVIKDFLERIAKTPKCDICQVKSPRYRKERHVKIFEKALLAKDRAAVAAKGLKAVDAMATRAKAASKQREARDEGVADVDESSANGAEEEDATGQNILTTHEVHKRLEQLFEKEQEILSLVYSARPLGKHSPPVKADMFFLEALLVPPSRYRPEMRQGEGRVNEAQQNALYKNILRCCSRIDAIKQELSNQGQGVEVVEEGGQVQLDRLQQAWGELQECVNSLIDKTKGSAQGMTAQRAEDGIKQKLERKEGLFRKNMMGKRVNYAARSVIAPDPHIEPGEIGVPPDFAKGLTYAEPVTMHNERVLAQAVRNGPDRWPGATAIESEGGQLLNLRRMSKADRESHANQLLTPSTTVVGSGKSKKVRRHLMNGDMVLMNRQPTLHKPSLMAHRVRVLPGERTLRMHYANCNTYNADFDGDEMNMHFPQSELARAEAVQLAATEYQYLSSTQGGPLRGLIQDHLSISVALCSKQSFFDRGEYHQLVYAALRPESGHVVGERLQVVTPAILKPTRLWTGKQVVTTILRNITPAKCGGLWMQAACKIKGSSWGPSGTEEGTVMFQDGHFVTGILDKSQLGPSPGGLVHSIHEVYGPMVAARLLSSLGRLLSRLLSMHAFTCGMDDLLLTLDGERGRREELEASAKVGLEVAGEYVGLGVEGGFDEAAQGQLVARLEEVMRDDSKQQGLDMLMNARSATLSTEVTKACLPKGLGKPFPNNNMQSMTTSGAKGSQVNANQISVNLGQQVLEGRRVPVMVSGKSLPSFDAFDCSIRSGGYIVNRFLTGIGVPEYYFHHMAGREGLIDTAVKTSRSGYLQRCIIKGMEGLAVGYDGTVRDTDSSVVQFLYGEDGLDATKQEFLCNFEFIMHNFDSQSTKALSDGAPVAMTSGKKKSAATKYMRKACGGRAKAAGFERPDPATSIYSPYTELGATSERFYEQMMAFLPAERNDLVSDGRRSYGLERGTTIKRSVAEKLLSTMFMRSLVEPGEAVGVVAGQSIGEPSTQMTLNTFHLAGHSAKNVTLGIPRLREILMTAARDISTPSMTLVVRDDVSHDDAARFARAISRLSLSDLLDRASVTESVGPNRHGRVVKFYKICLRFFPRDELMSSYGITGSQVVMAVEMELLDHLFKLVNRELKKRPAADIGASVGTVEMATSSSTAARRGDDSDADEDGDDASDEEDAAAAKRKANRSAAVSYGPNDDDDDLIQRQMAGEDADDNDGGLEDEGYRTSHGDDAEDESDDHEGSGDGDSDGDDESDTARLKRVREKYHERVTKFKCDNMSDGARPFHVEFVVEYDVDEVNFLMVQIVKDAARRALVQAVKCLGECTFVPEEKDDSTDSKIAVIHTTGVNLKAMWSHSDLIDVNRISTNDIGRVLDEYGVEACRANIIAELRSVFKSHNISVDYRHLSLIADFMTRSGDYVAFNRIGLKASISPLAKMSFETTVTCIKDALLDGDWDNLDTPSARLVLGTLGGVGSGSFGVLDSQPDHRSRADTVE